MNDEIIDSVAEKTGLDRAKAEEAIEAVLDYFRESPDKIREFVDVGKVDFKGLLEDAQKRLEPFFEKSKAAATEAKEKVAPVVAEGADKVSEQAKKASSKLKEMAGRDKNGASELDDVEDAVKEATSTEN